MSDVTNRQPGRAQTRQRYDTEAARYDERRYRSAEGRLFNDLEVGLLESWLAGPPGARILDLPAGTGRLTHPLAATGAKLVGADISLNMLQAAEAKRNQNCRGSVDFVQVNGLQLPFADDTFDAVISFKFFHLIPNDLKPRFIAEMTRVLKPGKPLIVEFNSPYYGGGLAVLRYYLQKKQPGGMRMKCIFPDQMPVFFAGLDVTRTVGVKLPLTGALGSLVGARPVQALNNWFGRLPGLKYLAYAIMIEARKPTSPRG